MRCNNQYDQLQQELVGASYKLGNKLLGSCSEEDPDRPITGICLSLACRTTQVKILNANTYTAGMIAGRRASIRSFWHSARAGTLASMYVSRSCAFL